ncbi:LamG domain-containing protein [Candidatus Wolfebacteria bacterium]|nr:LamG domain-containing protein [Candidatus Wolfebacteria bacterium]
MAALVMAWTNPSQSPPSGGGALYYSNGNIGIGTTTPNSKLTVQGDLKITGTSTFDGSISVYELSSAPSAVIGYGKIYALTGDTEYTADSYTKLLLHMNGTNGSTTFTDSETTPKTVTAVGNAQISTAQSKFGGASGLFNGNGDYLRVSSTDFDLGTGDFTIDVWMRANTWPAAGCATPFQIGNYFNNWIQPEICYTGTLLRTYTTTLQYNYYPSGGFLTNTWYHYAIVRSGTTMKQYINGLEISSGTNTESILNGTQGLWIGAYSGPLQFFNGYIDEFRISKGIARWTSNFTPPHNKGLYFKSSSGEEIQL